MKEIILISDIIDGFPVINGIAIKRIEIPERFINVIPKSSEAKSFYGADDIAKMLAHAIANKSDFLIPSSREYQRQSKIINSIYKEDFQYNGKDGIIVFTLSISSTAIILGVKFDIHVVGEIN